MVLLYRTDRREPIKLIETDNEQEANDVFTGAEDEWVESSKDKRPFRMKVPQRTSFLPSLIIEVTLESMSMLEYEQHGFVGNVTNGKSFMDTISGSNNNFGR